MRTDLATAAGLAVGIATGAAGAASAATVTFTGLPDEGGQLTTWNEDGILTTAQGGALAAEQPGSAHLDDGGTGFASALTFSTGGLFAATSFDILPSSNEYELCQDLGEGELDCDPYGFANVQVTGYADGALVASDAFDMFAANGSYVFDDAFADLDLLVIGFAPLPTDLPSGSFLSCDDSPCTHYSVDNVILAPVPLPASGALLAFGVVVLAAGYRRKR